MTILALTKCLQILLKDSTLSFISIAKNISGVGCIDIAENGKRHFFFLTPDKHHQLQQQQQKLMSDDEVVPRGTISC